jgi:hypothetical protein
MPVAEKPRIAVNTSGARNAPYIDLKDAIDKTRVLYQKAKRSSIHLSTAASYFGYSAKASSFTLIVSALKKYGLAVDEGSAAGRRIRVSDLGHQIVADTRETSPERAGRICRSALLPKTHRELWEQFGGDCLDENTLQVFLKLERGYSEDAARNAVKVYVATVVFAGLNQEGILGDVSADDAGMDTAIPQQHAEAKDPMDRQNTSPDWNSRNGDSSVRTLSIPLDGSRTFDLRFPTDLSKEDFDFILENMRLWERKIVAPKE